jgi:hypothetical protein
MDATFSNFLKAFAASWFTRMSGPLSVPLAIGAVFVPSDLVKLILAITAVICGVSASFSVWRRERLARLAEAPAGKRMIVKNAIGAAIREAEQLYRQSADRQRVEAWGTQINNVIVAAFGEGESALFLSDAGLVSYVHDGMKQEMIWLERRIRRLNELLTRADTISIRTDYTPTNSVAR